MDAAMDNKSVNRDPSSIELRLCGYLRGGVCIVAIQHRVTTAAFINGKHDRTWPLEDTLTRVAAVASTGGGFKQIIQPSPYRKGNRVKRSSSDQECPQLWSCRDKFKWTVKTCNSTLIGMLIIGKLGQPGQEPVESVRISWSLAKYNPGGLGKYKYKHDNLLMIIPPDCSHCPLPGSSI